MKKLLATVIVGAMVASLGAALASTPPHSSPPLTVSMHLPEVVRIRFTQGIPVAAVTPNPVQFHFPEATFEPEGTFSPTNLSGQNWSNVRVFANVGGWNVTVTRTGDTPHTDDFNWSKVRVTPTGDFYTVPPFDLPTAAATAQIFPATGTYPTRTGGDPRHRPGAVFAQFGRHRSSRHIHHQHCLHHHQTVRVPQPCRPAAPLASLCLASLRGA